MKNKLQNDDIVVFKNGNRAYYHDHLAWIIANYYDDELKCLTKDELSIVAIYRPTYSKIFEKEINNELKRR